MNVLLSVATDSTKQQAEMDALRAQQEAITREKRQIQDKYSRVVNSKCYMLLQDVEREQHEFFSDYNNAFIVKSSSELTKKVTQLLHESYCNIYKIYCNELIIHKKILDSFNKEILSQPTLAEADAHAEEMQCYHKDSLSKWKAKKESFINEIESRRELEVANINEQGDVIKALKPEEIDKYTVIKALGKEKGEPRKSEKKVKKSLFFEESAENIKIQPLSEVILASSEQEDVQKEVLLAGGEGQAESADTLA